MPEESLSVLNAKELHCLRVGSQQTLLLTGALLAEMPVPKFSEEDSYWRQLVPDKAVRIWQAFIALSQVREFQTRIEGLGLDTPLELSSEDARAAWLALGGLVAMRAEKAGLYGVDQNVAATMYKRSQDILT